MNLDVWALLAIVEMVHNKKDITSRHFLYPSLPEVLFRGGDVQKLMPTVSTNVAFCLVNKNKFGAAW